MTKRDCKEGALRDSFARLSEEEATLRRQPPTPARRARLAQIDRERRRIVRRIQAIEDRQESKESSIGIQFRFVRDPACKH